MTTQTQGTFASLLLFALLLVAAVGFYIFYCYCLKRICEKAGRDPGFLIWIPFIQMVPLLEVAQMPVWFIILFFVPIANLIITVMMWVKVCQARGKSGWLVLMMFIPILNLIFLPYLAFSE